MRQHVCALFFCSGAILALTVNSARAQSSAPAADPAKEWPTYGHDPGGMRFSPLKQITPENVGKLKVAWVYHMRPANFNGAGGRGPVVMEGRGPGGAVGDVPE